MVGELDILNEWIPEQMQPGTVFVLENAGEVGEKEDPYWAVLACPSCGMLGTDHAPPDQRLDPGHLRLGAMLRAVFHSRSRSSSAQTVLTRSTPCQAPLTARGPKGLRPVPTPALNSTGT